MWPSVGYGLCSNTGSIRELDKCLKNPYWKLVPQCGVIRTGPTAMRSLDRGFYGVGLPNPVIECMIAQIQSLLMHFGCPSSIGNKLQISTNALIMELGMSCQPFLEDYKKYGALVTDSWVKRLWEKVHEYGVKVMLDEGQLEIKPPRERDTWLMKEFIAMGFNLSQLKLLNKVRVYFQVLFLSDILGASGQSLDKRYLQRRLEDEDWSTFKFPLERPSSKAFRLWKQALKQLVPAGGRLNNLGFVRSAGHKIWEWRYDSPSRCIYHYYGEKMDVFQATGTW